MAEGILSRPSSFTPIGRPPICDWPEEARLRCLSHPMDPRTVPLCVPREDREDHLTLLLGNSREGAIEIAQREPPCRIGCCYRGWAIIVNLAVVPSRTLRRTPFTFRLCISVKRQARRLVPHSQRCCFAIARTRVSWTR